MSNSNKINSTKTTTAAANRRQRLDEQEVYYNPISRYKERIEVYGLTLYDIYREPRCVPTSTNSNGNDDSIEKDLGTQDEADTKVSKTHTSSGNRNYNKHIKQVNIIKPNTNNTLINNTTTSETKIISLKNLNSLFQCPICLGYMKKTFIVMECLHRFCGECIQKCLRIGKKECPSCRVHIPSRRSLRPDLAFDDVIRKVYGVSDVAALEEEKALEIEILNKERNMNNAYAESRKLGIMQQALLRRKMSRGLKPSTPSQDLESVTSSQTSAVRRNYSHNSGNAMSRIQRPAQPMVRISKLLDHSSPLVDFVLRRHPMERVVSRLRKEMLRTSKDIRIGQIKRFLGLKLSYEPWSQFQILIPIGGKLIALENSVKLARIFADVCGEDVNTSLTFQYRIRPFL